MRKLAGWIQKAVGDLVDPDKEERIEILVKTMHRGLQKHGQGFSLRQVVQGLEFSEKDLATAQERLYRKILSKGWRDEKLTKDEQEIANWVAKALRISDEKARTINLEYAQEYFSSALADAMEDGVLDKNEEAHLIAIAESVGSSLPDFARSFFRAEGEGFLRGIFMACVADGHISQDEWGHLLTTTCKLGIAQNELLDVIQSQAQRFVEHVLADAKADGRLSNNEETTLAWLVKNLRLQPGFAKYIRAEVSLLKAITQIEDGKLPTISLPRGTEIRAGEIANFHGAAVWRQVRLLKSGPKTTDHEGTVTLTDNRLIFSSPTKSHSTRYRKVVSHDGGDNWIEMQVEGKPGNAYYLKNWSPLPYAIFRMAVALANQTAIAKTQGTPSRHIPRDVRQRVWQRYGGRCVECGAADYLEFDHIIPVAKGGSNADTNIQLLCRRCNLKKSDHI